MTWRGLIGGNFLERRFGSVAGLLVLAGSTSSFGRVADNPIGVHRTIPTPRMGSVTIWRLTRPAKAARDDPMNAILAECFPPVQRFHISRS